MHLRLLDDFLRNERYAIDLKATDWVQAWTPTPILTEAQRTATNRQVAHLSVCRDPWVDWGSFSELATPCLTEIVNFIDFVTPLARRRAFDETRRRAVAGLQALAP